MSNTNRIGALIGLAVVLSAAGVWAQDWPQWRGPNRDGKLANFTAPKAWPKTLTKKWSAEVGTGVSSPVQAGDKLYAFGKIGGEEVTTCLDAANGKPLWQDKYPTGPVNKIANTYSGPRSTPTVADGKIFTVGVNGTVSCLDAASGKVVWRKETNEKPTFNASTSPLVADGKCIVFLNALTAFDVASGDIKWKGPTGAPYGSPVLMTVDGVKQIVTPTVDSLVGAGLADGKVLWQTKLPAGNYMINYSTPIIDGQTVIYGSPSKGAGDLPWLSKLKRKMTLSCGDWNFGKTNCRCLPVQHARAQRRPALRPLLGQDVLLHGCQNRQSPLDRRHPARRSRRRPQRRRARSSWP